MKRYQSKNWILIRYSLLLSILFALVFTAIFVFTLRSKKEKALKDFRNMDIVEAMKWLQENNLRPVIFESLDDEVEEFFIISQRPEPGIAVKEGRAITLVVSSGDKEEVMPDFIAMPFKDVRKQVFTLFSGSRLPKIVKLQRFSTEYEKGLVIDHSPRPGERIDSEKQIALIVSSGLVSDTFQAQDFSFKKYTSVSNILAENGIHSTATYLPTSKASNVGRIFEQSVPSGTLLIRGDKILFSVGVKKDSFVESQGGLDSVQQLRSISFTVPYETTGSDEIQNAGFSQEKLQRLFEASNLRSNKKDALPCTCIEDLSKTEAEKLVETGAFKDDSGTFKRSVGSSFANIPFRKFEVRIEDELGERSIMEEEAPAGLKLTLPYRSLGKGALYIYIDESMYKSERF